MRAVSFHGAALRRMTAGGKKIRTLQRNDDADKGSPQILTFPRIPTDFVYFELQFPSLDSGPLLPRWFTSAPCR